jgi:hypothetical protein
LWAAWGCHARHRADQGDGDTSRTLITELLTYDETPKVINPANGWLQNANDPP